MADIELVIKIDENEYNNLIKRAHENIHALSHVDKMILHGTPLPKGHGDLKDTEKLKNAFIAWSMAVQGNFTNADIASIICNSPTIIPADKAESEGK